MTLRARVGSVLAAAAVVAGTLVGAGASGAVAQKTTTGGSGSVGSGTGASGSSAPAAAPLPVGLSLVSQSTWVGLRQTFTMKLHIDNPTLANRPGAEVEVRVDESATSRSGFDDVIANGDPGDTLYANQVSIASLHPDAHHDVTIVFGLSNSGVRPTIGISLPGVYPVVVQLVNTGFTSGSFVTWLVAVDTRSPAPIEKKLSVSFVLQAVADPLTLADGSNDPKVVAQMKPGGRLAKIATLLAEASGVRLSVEIGPETAKAWKQLAQTDPTLRRSFANLRAAATRPSTELLPTTYVPIDAASLEAAGLGSYLPTQYTLGSSTLRSTFGANAGASAQSAFVDPAPTSDAAVDNLRTMLFDRVAVRDQALIPVTHPYTSADAFVLDTTLGESRGVATAPFIETLFNGNDPSALRAERVIAGLAEIAYETPSIARGIVIAPAARWNPDVPTMQTIFAALRSLPLVQSATLDDLFSTISDEQALGTNVQRRLVSAPPASAPVSADQYLTTSNELAAYSDVVGAKDPVVVKGKAALQIALSTSLSPARVTAMLSQIDVAVRSFTAGVKADEKRITLTSRRADVPLTFENDLKPTRNVTVRVHLDSAKLTFPKGADQEILLKPGSNTVRFSVEARASGTFPMTISVTSPDGRLQFGGPVQVTVRSAVFGGWAVGLTVAALVFLAGWWANHFRRTRRNRRAERQSTPTPTPAPAT